MELRGHLLNVEHELKHAQAQNYNAISTHNANLRAEKSELESRLNITQKDLDRLARDVNSRQVA
jgi:ABC-type phosphate transport system auxiliary subunit